MRKKQSYYNHKRYHPLYHFLLLPACLLFFFISVYLAYSKGVYEHSWLNAFYHLLAGMIALIAAVLIRKQALVLQNRVIRSEIRFRYYVLTGQSLGQLENQLSTQQLVALRFASDTELISLIQQAMAQSLSPVQIKKKIRHWKGDYNTV